MLILLTVAAVAAGAGYHYVVTRVDEKIRVEFESKLREHYQGLSVSVHSAELIEGEGIEIRGISIVQPTGDVMHAELAHIDEIVVSCNTDWQNLIRGKVDADQITVRRLKLHAVKGADGHWSAERLFPLPKFGGLPPPVHIQQAAIALIDPSRAAEHAFVLRDCNVAMIPEVLPSEALSDAPPRQQIKGEIKSDQFEKLTLEGVLDPVLGEWEMWGSLAGLKLSSHLIKSLPVEVPPQVQQIEGFRATTDLKFRIAGGVEGSDSLKFVSSGTIREGRYEDRRLPYAVTGIRGDFRCDRSGWKLEKLSANSGGTSLSGSITGNRYDSTSDFNLHVDAEQLMLDRRLVAILPATMQDIWQQFTPTGILNVDFDLQRAGGLYFPAAQIECLDASFAHEMMPYRLEHATGNIGWQNGQISIGLQAWAARQAVNLQGDFTQQGTDVFGKLSFESEGPLPIDQKMLAALQTKPEVYEVIASMQPRGALKISGAVEKKEATDTEFDLSLKVGFHDCSMRYEKFPYPVDHIFGIAELAEGTWTFQGLEGSNDSGYILCDGSYQPGDSPDSGLHLDFRCSNVPLEDELRLALPERMQKAWTDLQPIGVLDQLNIRLRYGAVEGEAEKKLSVNATAVKQPVMPGSNQRSLSMQPTWFPYRLDGLTGTARYHDGQIVLEQIRAHHGRTNISCEGVGSFNDLGWAFEITRYAADRLHADTDLLTALPDSLSGVANGLQIQGPVSLQGRFTAASQHEAEAGLQLSWDMTIDLEDGSLNVGVPVEHIHGGIRLIGGSSGKQFVSGGEIKVDSLIYQDLQLLDVRGPVWFDRKRLLVGAWVPRDPNGTVPRRLQANVLGGQIMGDAQILFSENTPFSVQANVVEADLQQAATHFAPKLDSIAGKAFAGLELQGDASGSHTLRGRGQVRLRNADIYELPVMLAMLKLISVKRPDSSAFTDSDIDFRVDGEHVYFDRINFNGDAISLRGNGEVDFQRRLNLKFYTLVGNDQLRTRFLESVLGEASKQILMIQVTGTADQPQVKREAFPGLNESLQQLFPELVQPRKQQQPPTRSNFGHVLGTPTAR